MGYIFKTSSGHIYEIAEPYIDVVVEIIPKVLVLTDGSLYKLTIEGFSDPVICRMISGTAQGSKTQLDGESDVYIESKIDGEFTGYEYGKIFKLRNGQIWQQTSSRYRYRYRYGENIIILFKDGHYQLKAEDLDDWVKVERIK